MATPPKEKNLAELNKLASYFAASDSFISGSVSNIINNQNNIIDIVAETIPSPFDNDNVSLSKLAGKNSNSIREKLSLINNVPVCFYDFNKANSIEKLFKDLQLQKTGEKSSTNLMPKFVYDLIDKQILDKIFELFSIVFSEFFKENKIDKKQFFVKLIDGLSAYTKNPDDKKTLDALLSNFDKDIALKVANKILSEIYKNPKKVDEKFTKKIPQIFLPTTINNDFFNSDLNVEFDKFFLTNGALDQPFILKEKNYQFFDLMLEAKTQEKIFPQIKTVPVDFFVFMRAAKDVFEYLYYRISTVFGPKQEPVEEYKIWYSQGQAYPVFAIPFNPNSGIISLFGSGNEEEANYSYLSKEAGGEGVPSVMEATDQLRNFLPVFNSFLQKFKKFIKDFEEINKEVDDKYNKEGLFSFFIEFSKEQKNTFKFSSPILQKIKDSINDFLSQFAFFIKSVPNIIVYKHNYKPVGATPDYWELWEDSWPVQETYLKYEIFLEISRFLGPFFKIYPQWQEDFFPDNLIMYPGTYFQQKIEEFLNYVKSFNDLLKSKNLDIYLSALEKTKISFPPYEHYCKIAKAKYYVEYPDLSVQILYNKKVDIYKNKNPKLLFIFSKPELFSFDNTGEPEQYYKKYVPSPYQKEINQIQPQKIFLYRTDVEPKKFSPDLFGDGNLIKEIDIEKDGLSFYEKIDVNKDYYYFFVAKDLKPTKEDLEIIFDNYVFNVNENLFYSASPIFKIKLVKDNDFYYLEEKFYDASFFTKKEKKYEKVFKEKIGIIPDLLAFNFGYNGFNTKQKYFKMRVISKKSRKKIDFNLKFTINNNIKKSGMLEKNNENVIIEELVDIKLKNLLNDKFKNKIVIDSELEEET